MANITLNDPFSVSARGTGRRQRLQDDLFHGGTLFFALLVLLLLGGVIVALTVGAWPALRTFGFGFLVTEVWNPVTDKFGALAPIYGTIVTSLIAMVIGVPVSLGIAVFITELCPAALKRPVSSAAARPSVTGPQHCPSSTVRASLVRASLVRASLVRTSLVRASLERVS